MDARKSSKPLNRTANQTAMELTSDLEIVITRTFNGPPRIVFEAWTRPELVRRWWAPKALGVSVVSIDADVRVGGRYRYVLQRGDGGGEVAFSGTYREVAPPSRLVYTQAFEPYPDEVIITITLTERDGQTDFVSHELWPSKEIRDMAMSTGMEKGMRMTMDQLDELVASLSEEA